MPPIIARQLNIRRRAGNLTQKRRRFKTQDTFIFGKPRGENFLDGGTHFYDTYETKDGRFMAVGSIEPNFYAKLLQGLDVSEDDLPQTEDPEEMRKKLSEIFLRKTRDEWSEIFDAIADSCVTPVLEMDEAKEFGHNAARKSFVPHAKGSKDPVNGPTFLLNGPFQGIFSLRSPRPAFPRCRTRARSWDAPSPSRVSTRPRSWPRWATTPRRWSGSSRAGPRGAQRGQSCNNFLQCTVCYNC